MVTASHMTRRRLSRGRRIHHSDDHRIMMPEQSVMTRADMIMEVTGESTVTVGR